MAAGQDPFGWIGHVLEAKYRIDAVIGEGGFGVVYRAHHLGFAETVAVKCLKLKPTLGEEARDEFLKRFIAEGRLLHQLSRGTADVVQALDVGVATSPSGIETPFLVLEWLEGTTLDRELDARKKRGERLDIDRAIEWLEPAARGLAIAHDQGIAHRDIKPGNLMLCDVAPGRAGGRLTLKVVDFGIAKAPDDATTSSGPFDSLGTNAAAFTPRYGAPEQFSRRYGATGPWTDVYALALVFVEVVRGEPALEGDDPVQLYIASSDLKNRPTLRQLGIPTSDSIEHVLVRALAVDPRHRFQSCGEFWDALAHAAHDPEKPRAISSVRPRAISSKPPSNKLFERDAGASASTTGTQVTNLLREQRTRKLGIVAGLVLVGAFLVAVIWAVASPTEPNALVGVVDAASSSAPAVASTPAIQQLTLDSGPPANMVLVPKSTFVMGSDHDSKNERPVHGVTITHAFWIDRTEVTTEAYAGCIAKGDCSPVGKVAFCNSTSDPNLSRQPVNCVSYEQASTFCRFAGKRLPTEAEWELAARGTRLQAYPWGDDPPTSCRQAIVGGLEGPCGKRRGTYDVGTTIDGASTFGVFDMAGNVWEWVADGFDTYPKEDAVDPFVAPRGGRGIVRGGSWDYSPAGAKSTMRLPIDRTTVLPNVGFRCVK